jgi:(p)ppGpp synthase/HD superfamily hydrolase
MNKAQTSSFSMVKLVHSAHRGQLRRYTNEEYWTHLHQVAGLVSSVANYHTTFETITVDQIDQIARGHDLIEDTEVTEAELRRLGYVDVVVEGIGWLTDSEEGKRQSRKRQACERLKSAPGYVQSIKCADILSNSVSIFRFDPGFAPLYLSEVRAMLSVFGNAHQGFREFVQEEVERLATIHGVHGCD